MCVSVVDKIFAVEQLANIIIIPPHIYPPPPFHYLTFTEERKGREREKI